MDKENKLPIGIQDFEKIRNQNYLYIDKTEFIWNLTKNENSFFLSRPRRFGKSLLISTMEAYFSGRKELFTGLAISEHENKKGSEAWTEYPVIKFSLSGGDYHSDEGLTDRISATINECAKKYNLAGEFEVAGETPPVRFRSLIEQLYSKTSKQVVVLVDEYDKPLLATMVIDEKQEERNRQIYKSFFSVLKDEDHYLKFVFFTGVTKFSKVSIFSDLNHLEDISLDDEYSAICGITEDELKSSFQKEIKAMAKANDMTEEECLSKLAKTYDGYCFSKNGKGVYNPFSLLNAFKKKDFSDYWFETGTPTFLVNKLRKSSFRAENFENGVECREAELKDYRTENPNPIPLFYQSGYLTIKGFDREFRLYTLKFPNDEVKYGFFEFLVPLVLGEKDEESPYSLKNMVIALRNGDTETFKNELVSLFASIPYTELPEQKYESEWRNQIFLILKLLGQNVECEVRTAKGRCDCVVETQKFIYLFEFKMDKGADEALKQIDEKGYAEKYKADSRKIIKIGVSFSTEKRNIAEWKEA